MLARDVNCLLSVNNITKGACLPALYEKGSEITSVMNRHYINKNVISFLSHLNICIRWIKSRLRQDKIVFIFLKAARYSGIYFSPQSHKFLSSISKSKR